MKILTTLFLSITLLFTTGSSAWTAGEKEAFIPQRVIILGSYKDYASALKAAHEISKKSNVPFSTRGMVYTPKKGLVWPNDPQNQIAQDQYMARRYNDDCDKGQKSCITIERSEFYDGIEPDYYILVGGIFSKEGPKAGKALRSFQKTVPEAYSKISTIYMGCMH